MPSQKFCFCIPVRFGVFVLSFWSLIASGLCSGLGWAIIAKGDKNNVYLSKSLRTNIIIASVMFTIFALVALAGLIGSLVRSRQLVRTFTVFLWIQLIASLAYFIVFTVALFDKSFQSTLVKQCVTQVSATHANTPASSGVPTADEIQKGCGSVFGVSKVLFFVSYALFFFLTLYACVICHRYGSQLSQEKDMKIIINSNNSSVREFNAGTGAAAPTTYSEYPYTQPEHRFGNRA